MGPRSSRGHRRRRGGAGFAGGPGGHTLVEIAVALAIIAVLAALAIWSSRSELATFRLKRTARMFHADLQYLRAEAIASDREMRLRFLAADADMDPAASQVGSWILQAGNRSSNSNDWDTLPIDEDGEVSDVKGTRDIGEDGNREEPAVSLLPWPTLRGPGGSGGNADCIVYSPRGILANPPSDFVNGYITVEFVNKDALLDGVDQRLRIRVSRSGYARLEAGASSTLPDNAVGSGTTSTMP
jgi:prepilin-type N-terminal cleavage/methylation domain-containing protein